MPLVWTPKLMALVPTLLAESNRVSLQVYFLMLVQRHRSM